MNILYKSAQASLIAKDYHQVALIMLQNDFDYVIGDAEYMVSMFNQSTGKDDLQLRSNDHLDTLLNTF
jgi:hypothetical protein